MAQHERNRLGVQPRVQSIQHRAAHRHAEMRLVDRRYVRCHHRYGVIPADAATLQRGREPATARIGLTPGEALLAMHNGRMIRMHVGGTLDERERRKRRVVGLVPVEPDQIGAGFSHAVPPALYATFPRGEQCVRPWRRAQGLRQRGAATRWQHRIGMNAQPQSLMNISASTRGSPALRLPVSRLAGNGPQPESRGVHNAM